ncbi:MAG: polysaccharide pyruvyl transferase family protein, partial [Acidobacteriota bacterium]|nr:polysaccharide pyruvyl transferase family protein [Acidobacteriota bacterium]
LDADRFYAERFRTQWMNYPAVGPFLINPENLPKGGVISYISCGVPHDFEATTRDNVRRAFDQARTIYLRDEQSAEKLRRAGVHRAIHVAPDLTVTLSDQFNYADQAKRGREILVRLGVENDRLILCFQSQPYPGFSAAEILRELKRYIERTGSAVVLLPTGYCHGDHEFLQNLASQSGGTLKYAGVSSIFDMMAVIASSDVFVGTSLHGNITAFSFGIPHLFGPLPVAKSEGFLSAANLPRTLKLGAWSEINERIDMAQGLGREFFAQRAREAKAKVYSVVDEVLQDLLK